MLRKLAPILSLLLILMFARTASSQNSNSLLFEGTSTSAIVAVYDAFDAALLDYRRKAAEKGLKFSPLIGDRIQIIDVTHVSFDGFLWTMEIKVVFHFHDSQATLP